MKRCECCGQLIIEKSMTIKDIQKTTNIGYKVIKNACIKGELPALQVGGKCGKWYIKEGDFQRWYEPILRIN